jgi:hypothetical protein
MTLQVDVLDNELIRVCLTEDGFTNCCLVSSMHLAQDKERQLRAANLREALGALGVDPMAA